MTEQNERPLQVGDRVRVTLASDSPTGLGEYLLSEICVVTGIGEPPNVKVESSLRPGLEITVRRSEVRVDSPEDHCETCGHELLWDAAERMHYCPNTWEHG